jgi:hypothetical protein
MLAKQQLTVQSEKLKRAILGLTPCGPVPQHKNHAIFSSKGSLTVGRISLKGVIRHAAFRGSMAGCRVTPLRG